MRHLDFMDGIFQKHKNQLIVMNLTVKAFNWAQSDQYGKDVKRHIILRQQKLKKNPLSQFDIFYGHVLMSC